MSTQYQNLLEEILELAGVKINGGNPWDIQVNNDKFYRRAITEGELGLGESYMEGQWDAEKIDEFIFRVLRAELDQKIKRKWSIMLKLLKAQIFNLLLNGCKILQKKCSINEYLMNGSRLIYDNKKILPKKN